jgi:hypothetical protein
VPTIAKDLIGKVAAYAAPAKASGLRPRREWLECGRDRHEDPMRAEIAAIAAEIKQSLELLRRHL